MTDLGTLRSNDTFALAESINDRGDVVGFSCGPVDCRGFLWRYGKMTDVNSFLPQNSLLLVTNAADINFLRRNRDPSFGPNNRRRRRGSSNSESM